MKALGFEITFAEVERFFHSWIFQLVCLAGSILFGFMAFGPENTVQQLQLDGIRKLLGPWLGILFVFCAVSWVVVFVQTQWLKFRVSRLYKGKDADARIQRLSPAARGYLCEMMLRPDHAGRYPFHDPTFLELRNAKAIWTPSSGDLWNWSCYVQPWVVEWMEKNPEMLEEYQQVFLR